jgi:hypothetical protein
MTTGAANSRRQRGKERLPEQGIELPGVFGEEEQFTPVVPGPLAGGTEIHQHALGSVDFIQSGPAMGTIHRAGPSLERGNDVRLRT